MRAGDNFSGALFRFPSAGFLPGLNEKEKEKKNSAGRTRRDRPMFVSLLERLLIFIFGLSFTLVGLLQFHS